MKKDKHYKRALKLDRLWNENAIKQTWRKEGFKEGFNKGVEETETRKNIEIINRLLNEKTIPVSKIAELVEVDEAYVLEIKNAMSQK